MKVIQLGSNLGNQMFQYALYLSLQHHGIKVRIDDYTFYHYPNNWRLFPRLQSSFNLTYKRLHLLQFYRKPININYSFFKFKYIPKNILEDNSTYNPQIFQSNQSYLVGYWQSEKYFQDENVQAQLRQDFQLPQSHIYPEEYKIIEQQINEKNAVSIHIRRTDYLSESNQGIYGNICTDLYYDNAINYRKHTLTTLFFMYSVMMPST